MAPILVNEEKCVGCELCVKDCPSGCLYIENGKAYTKKGGCLECGHCYSVCPQGAIIMREDEEGFEYPMITEDQCIRCGMCLRVCPIKGAAGK